MAIQYPYTGPGPAQSQLDKGAGEAGDPSGNAPYESPQTAYGGATGLTGVLTADNDAGGLAIANLADPSDDQDAATKAYADSLSVGGSGIPSGGPLTEDLDADGNSVVNLADPVDPQDAATKAYVDGAVTEGAGAPGDVPTRTDAIHVDTGGGVYVAKADLSGWWGPFSGGGADLSAFRLAGIGDDGTARTNETDRDEMEYADTASMAAVWVPRSHTGTVVPPLRAGGSAGEATEFIGGQGIVKGVTYPTEFEDAFLVTGHELNEGLCGIALLDNSGNGVAPTSYNDGHAYVWTVADYQADGSHVETDVGTSVTDWQDGRPKWIAIRKTIVDPGVTVHYRVLAADEWSDTLGDWTVILDTDSPTMPGLVTRVGWGRWFAAGQEETESVHAWVHAEPDFGFA